MTYLIWRNLVNHNIIEQSKEHVPAKRLTLVFDNCTGQNKNISVIRLGLYLVEIEIYKEVEILFYVVGHTKNTCDRLFSNMKHRCHKSTIYTMSQLDDVLNTCDLVTSTIVNHDVFYKWDTYLDKMYKEHKPGSVAKIINFFVLRRSLEM